MSRRHDSLIPLSQQHQHALALAVIIRRRFGMEKGEARWRDEMVEKIRKAYQAELSGHFEVEEAVLFPEMERYLGRLELVPELRGEHETLRGLVRRVEASRELTVIDEFSAVLEGHVRKEERQLFAEFERRMPRDEAVKVGKEIEARLSKSCSKL